LVEQYWMFWADGKSDRAYVALSIRCGSLVMIYASGDAPITELRHEGVRPPRPEPISAHGFGVRHTAQRGDGAVVELLTGEAGIGKRAFLRAVAAQASRMR
jgi:hypothetical protein